MRLDYIIAADNDIFTMTNSAFRLSGSGNANIYNNTIHSEYAGWSTGPGIQLDKGSGYISENVEIYNNTFHTLNGAGIWLTGEDKDDVIRGKNVHIHHNIFHNVGQYWSDTGYSNAAITIGQFNNTIIENNVIDDGGHAGIKYYIYHNYHMNTQFTTIVRNNVIMNANDHSAAGLWNYDDTNHIFIPEYNCIYGNIGGAYSGTNIIQTNDIHVDPLFVDPSNYDYHLKSNLGRWSDNDWIIDDATSPLIDAGHPTSDYSNEPLLNGNRTNIGRYGNTAEASKSVSDQPITSAGIDQTVTTGDTVTLDGSASTDDVGITSYVWDFDDSNGLQQDATGAAVQHTYNMAGTYTATLTVTDGDGNADFDTVAITVNERFITPKPNETISSTYDNRLREASPDLVLYYNDYIDIGHNTDVGRYRDVMWFNLSMYNTTDTISTATLSLYWYYPEDSTRNKDTVVEIYRPVDWDPDYVNWNSRTSDTPWNTPGGDWFDMNEVAWGSVSYASVTFTGTDVPDNRFYEFDVTELVQDYISGKYGNTGFFLKAQDEYDNYISFYSSDYSNADQRPKLTVTQNHALV
ncbi:MAG: PKD repeat-containing protein [Candidatus Methanomarinus sp.]|nr:MAG: PKD repeat-containing protein [ANME-2 cluster archaeon]